MKKSLFALAMLGTIAGAASAQTNVTIYGIADVGVSRVDTDASQATWGLTSGQQSGSRLGFRGTEDLGNGMSAIFNLENGFNVDTGAQADNASLFNRQAFVGLKSTFGTVKLGRQYTPLHNAQVAIDPFGTNLAGNIQNVFTAQGIRMNNTVNLSHSFGGVSGELAYGFGEQPGAFTLNRQIGAGLTYANGPLLANITYGRQDTAPGTNNETIFVGGTYDLKVVKAHLAAAFNKVDATTDSKSRDYMLGVSAPLGTGTVLASYARHDQREGAVGSIAGGRALAGAGAGTPRIGVDAAGAAIDYDQVAIGYSHPLSKRTNLYTSYSRLNAKPNAAVDGNIFNAGVRHQF